MNRHVKALTLLLAAQLLILAGILVWQQRDQGGASGTLLAVDRATVDGLLIEDDTGAKIKLVRKDAGWTLPDSGGLPVDAEKVSQLLDKLFAADAPWPVATSAESAKRFEVTADKFQRRIQLLVADQVAGDLYLGTSPGFRKVHARLAESDDVYAITFANFEATTKPDDWLDKALLKPADTITALARPEHWALSQSGDVWTLDGLAQGETTKQDAAKDLVNKVTNLRVMGIAEQPPAPGSDAALTLTARTANGEFDYQFYRPTKDSDFVVRRSGQDGYFKVAAYVGEPMLVERADLVASAEAGAPAASAAPVAPAAKTAPVRQ
jgi:Domain of unknown function (DUF4340)